MPTSSRLTRRLATALASCVTLALAPVLAATPVHAATPTELFISEYVEGSSNNKALEIYNGTGASVDLATAGYSVQMYFNGAASAGLTINLTGTVASGGVHVLAHGSAGAAILAEADQTNSGSWFNGDDAVALLKGSTVLDVVGQIGVDPGTEWGTGVTSTADNTLRRKAAVVAGDSDGSNAFDPATEWDGFAVDTFDGLGTHGGTTPDPDPEPEPAPGPEPDLRGGVHPQRTPSRAAPRPPRW
jgi:predicted extracellular nuclease